MAVLSVIMTSRKYAKMGTKNASEFCGVFFAQHFSGACQDAQL